MTDFVTRLESELHAAALRQERRGRVGGAALPRLRVALGELPTAALATAVIGLVIAAAAILLSLSPRQETTAHLPAELQGVWRAPPTELRLYDRGSERCRNLALPSTRPCYTLGESATRVASEWGRLSIAGDELTLRGVGGAAPGVYRWSFAGASLRLAKVSDPNRERVRALVAMPLSRVRHVNRHPGVPVGWGTQKLVSKRFGYSLRAPHYWSIDTNGKADHLSGDAWRQTLPEVSVTAQRLDPGTSAARWGVIVDSISESSSCAAHAFRRFFVGGMKIRVSVYRHCGAPHLESASFINGGRGYRITWRGKATRPEHDYARFDAMLKSLRFSP